MVHLYHNYQPGYAWRQTHQLISCAQHALQIQYCSLYSLPHTKTSTSTWLIIIHKLRLFKNNHLLLKLQHSDQHGQYLFNYFKTLKYQQCFGLQLFLHEPSIFKEICTVFLPYQCLLVQIHSHLPMNRGKKHQYYRHGTIQVSNDHPMQ